MSSTSKFPVVAPAVSEGDAVKLHSAAELDAMSRRLAAARDPQKPTIVVCGGSGCRSAKCSEVIDALREALVERRPAVQIELRVTGCHGFCERGPLMVVMPEGIFYQRVKPADAEPIVEQTVLGKKVLDELLYREPGSGKAVVREAEIPFYAGQKQVVLRHNRLLEPTSLDDYLAVGGYRAMARVLTTMTPADTIAMVKRSGLRGRDGGGFPTGVEWESAASAAADERFVICNAGEGDPGARADRALAEGNPHSVLEGMIVGAWAIGARQGFVFVRDEHVPAVLHLSLAVEEARDRGLLGRNILGTGHSFNVRIVRGAGSFVCGESTALLAAIEGRAVEPQVRYVHPAEQGLWGKPTVLSNAETWANVPLVAAQGDVAQLPSGGSSGTKVFTLAGRVSHAGLVEVALGTRLRSVIFDIGGGVRRGRPLKAVQIGGPSGGCLPESLLDVPLDFDDLTRVGATIGSGGLAVMDDRTCMVDVARRYVRFLQGEGCGKCVACREGLRQLGAILGRIVAGQGRSGDIELLEELAQTVAGASLCAVGGTAPNPVLTTIRHFRDEYEEHIVAHRCPAGRCPDLVRHRIDAAKCDGCGECVSRCPPGCIRGEKGRPHTIDESACTECGVCRDVCEPDAVVAE